MTEPIAQLLYVPTGGNNTFAFMAKSVKDGHQIGFISATRIKIRGRVMWYVANVRVDPLFRRRAIATSLYTAAATEACRRRGRLISIGPRVETTDAFWKKQLALGTVTKMATRGMHSDRRGVSRPTWYYVVDCPPRLKNNRRRTSRR